MKVLKFGGTSVGSIESIQQVKKIVEALPEPGVVVVSAFSGVTNKLQAMANLAANGKEAYIENLMEVEARHLEAVKQLLPVREQSSILAQVKVLINELSDILRGVSFIRELTPRTLDLILSFGERLSAFIISHAIDNCFYADSRQFIRTNSRFNNAVVDFKRTYELINEHLKLNGKTALLPGFIASNEEGITTTLGRGGSDYSAAIYAAALLADVLEIWTDVDGFMTADPSKVKKAYPIAKLSYAEAMELSHFGAKVIYTPTIQPVFEKLIPVLIKNTFNPEAPGSLISKSANGNKKAIKGISSIDKVALINVQGTSMVGVTGISSRLFGALAKASVNIILISQASSECSISFAIAPSDVAKAQKALDAEFLVEMTIHNNISINIVEELSVIAIVGENMQHTPGIAAGLFNSLGRNGINIVAIAQGSSELNISTVIANSDLMKALNVIHDGFFLSENTEVNLFLTGIGNVGKKLIQMIAKQQDKLLKQHRLKINVSGISNSRKMIFDENGICLDNYADVLANEGQPANLDEFIQNIKKLNLRNSIFIDCTANETVAMSYEKVLKNYISVVTANKIACSSSFEHYQKLKEISLKRGVKFLYETNVGAGLPVLKTISELIKSGDAILKLEAVVSGTLNFIFNIISDEIPLSVAIQMAVDKGYAEPDPRIDLSGTDVLRKLLILSRECGYPLEKADVAIKNFLPDDCFTSDMAGFWAKVKALDADFEAKRKALEAQGKKWRYVAVFEEGNSRIELLEVDATHPFYNLEGSDNIISMHTERYSAQPLIIKGAGAGADVTATGVFADIIRIANI
jgi:bifunctional aspartokinase / homoserine dehydrogenase 1